MGEVLAGGGYDPPGGIFGRSKLGSLGVFRAWDPEQKDFPDKMTSNGTLKNEIGDIFFSMIF